MKSTEHTALKPFFYFFMFLLLAFSVLATDYSVFNDNKGLMDDGLFKTNFEDTAVRTSKSLSNAYFTPLIDDLDGDGIPEVVTFNDNGFQMHYNNNGILAIKGSYTNGSIDGFITYGLLYDIDGDGLTEVLFSDRNRIYIIQVNGTSIDYQNSFDYDEGQRPKSVMFNCITTDRCAIIYVDTNTFQIAGARYVYTKVFSSTTLEAKTTIDTLNGGGNYYVGFCFPDLKYISLSDYDYDGEVDFNFNYARYSTQSGITKQVFYSFHINASNDIDSTNSDAVSNEIYVPYPSGSCLSNGVGMQFSSALLTDLDGDMSNGDEWVVAETQSGATHDYRIHSYRGGSQVDVFPSLQNQEGELISNVFLATAFPDTPSNSDVCVMGFDDADNIAKILCGNTQSNELLGTDTREFYFPLTGTGINYTIPFTTSDAQVVNYRSMTASTQHWSNNIDDDDGLFNPSEFITPYGVLGIEVSSWEDNPSLHIKDAELDLIYPLSNVYEAVNLLSIDLKQGVYSADLIYSMGDYLVLEDNQETNQPARISDFLVNPCTNQSGLPVDWLNGTKVTLKLWIDDTDQIEDDVSSRAYLYYGEGAGTEQSSNWTNWTASGYPMTHTFYAYNITSQSILYWEYKDYINEEVSNYSITFSVGTSGVEYDDCTYSQSFTYADAPEIEPDDFTPDLEDNVFRNTLSGIDDLAGLGLGITVIWYILMAFFGYLAVVNVPGGAMVQISALFIVEAMMMLIGVTLGFIGWGTIVLVALGAIAIISLKFRSYVTGEG